jgi:hypothetical protein
MDTKRTPRCSIRVQVSETRVASEKSGREMMISKRKILCLALLASTAACGGGGGGGGGGTSSTTGGGSPGTTTPAPAVGSTQFGNPSAVMTSNGTATMASNATSQSVTFQDGEIPDPNNPQVFWHKDLLAVTISDGGVTFVGSGNAACKPGSGCQTTGHVFDLTNDVEGTPGQNSAPGTTSANFPTGIAFTGNGQPTFATANFPHDPTFMVATDAANANNTVTFDSSLSFSLYGIWEGTDDKTGQPIVGAFAAPGEGRAAAPFTSLPKIGTAEYDGRAIAAAVTNGSNKVTHLDGTSVFNANFATMSLSGMVNLNNAATGAAFTTLTYAPASIVSGTNGQAAVGSSITASNGMTGTGQTTFFGAANPAQGTIPPEIGSVFTVSGSGTTVTGAAGGALKH